MSDFDLDLQAVETEIAEEGERANRVVLGVLNGRTPEEEWVAEVEDDAVLVLAVEGDLNTLAGGFARDIREMGGELIHFRKFLLVTPPGVSIDTDRLE
jgi:MinD-like ATPase involved in chromosome partitioning or flagellar assembly